MSDRPKNTWRSTYQEDLEEKRFSWNGVRRVASDRNKMEESRRQTLQQEWKELSITLWWVGSMESRTLLKTSQYGANQIAFIEYDY